MRPRRSANRPERHYRAISRDPGLGVLGLTGFPALSGSENERRYLVDGLLVHPIDELGVDVTGDGDRCMTEPARDDTEVDSGLESQRGMGIA